MATGEWAGTVRGHGEHPLRVGVFVAAKTGPILVHFHRRIVVVIKSCTLHLGIVQRKSQGFDQMQLHAGIGAQADNIAGIRRDFWFDQDDMKQFNSLVDMWKRAGKDVGTDSGSAETF